MAEPSTEAAPKLMPAAVGIRLGACTLTLAVSRLGAGFEPLPSVVAGDRCVWIWFARVCKGPAGAIGFVQ
jgi:hypothetical protein